MATGTRNVSNSPESVAGPRRNPLLAAGLSLMIPGLGQLYNRSRTGLVFFSVGLVNLVLLCAVFRAQPIIDALNLVSQILHLRLNQSVTAFLLQLHDNLAGGILILASTMFIAYVALDAYKGACLDTRRKSGRLFEPVNLALSEAIGASYIVHAAALLLLFLICSFTATSHKVDKHEAVCEFVLQETNEVNKSKTENISLHSSKDHGKRDQQREVSKTHASAASQESSMSEQTRVQEQQKQQEEQQAQVARDAVQMHTPVNKVTTERPREEQATQRISRKTALAKSKYGFLASEPKQADTKQQQKQKHQQKQQQTHRQIAVSRPAQQARQAIRKVAQQSGTSRESRYKTASRRSPYEAGRSFNQSRDIDDAPGAVAANADVNFGPYMNQLQRRMKRNWDPPAGGTSRAVTVLFRIHPDGRISNVRLVRSSGSGACDRAALSAVQATSPFLPLPDGARSAVSIEFTFDYGVSASRARPL